MKNTDNSEIEEYFRGQQSGKIWYCFSSLLIYFGNYLTFPFRDFFFSHAVLTLFLLFPKNIWWFHIYLFTLPLFSYRSLVFGWGWGREFIYRKGVTWRFVLDVQESGSSGLIVKIKATMTSIRMCNIRHFHIADSHDWLFLQSCRLIHIRRGLRRCSFDN